MKTALALTLLAWAAILADQYRWPDVDHKDALFLAASMPVEPTR